MLHHTVSSWLRRSSAVVLALLFALLFWAVPASAQSVSIGGFIKSSYYYDTNQVVSAREGDFLLYPVFSDTDGDGENDEANETDNLLFFPFFSRLSLSITDLPEAFGATATGYIETDFFGPTNGELNTLRIRRAFAKLDWGTREALFGMEWSPFFLSAWARTIATEAGAPFEPFARMPMIKLTLKPERFRLSGLVAQQRDAFQEIGGLKQQQQSGLPSAMLSAEYLLGGGSSVGVNAMTKWIRPELTSDRFSSGAVQGFLNVVQEGFEVRSNVTYGGDLADHLMTGGYAVLGEDDFEPLNVLATWVDAQTTGPVSVGVFGGYLQNLGTSEDGLQPIAIVARNPDIDTVWRLSPRVAVTSGRVRIAGELQVTTAAYAERLDDALAPEGETVSVTNVRGNLSVFLTF